MLLKQKSNWTKVVSLRVRSELLLNFILIQIFLARAGQEQLNEARSLSPDEDRALNWFFDSVAGDKNKFLTEIKINWMMRSRAPCDGTPRFRH